MNENPLNFGQTAKSLARNPLGIIALFIVLIYGVAGLVTAFASSLTASERLLLIWFLVIFPVIVLVVFAWLVSKHSGKLFSPGDFKNEENYVKMQMTTVASLTAATVKSDVTASENEIQKIVDAVRQSLPTQHRETNDWRNHVLWVDDRPENNIYERRAFESVGLQFTLTRSTNEALDFLKGNKYAAIISDMGRREGNREGYVLLDAIRRQGNKTPYIIYAGSNLPEHNQETLEHGGQGTTNHPQELFQIVMKAIITHN
ncbi:MAG: response regulator [Anaerolineales bacterium]